MTILYVDDDVNDCDLFVKAVNVAKGDKNVECEVAHNGEEALSKVNLMEDKPAFIFLDVNMPRMDGKEFVKRSLNESKFKGIPIVVYSTFISHVDIEYFHNHRAFHYITKPGSFDTICEHITWALGLI